MSVEHSAERGWPMENLLGNQALGRVAADSTEERAEREVGGRPGGPEGVYKVEMALLVLPIPFQTLMRVDRMAGLKAVAMNYTRSR
jgi:hypothetical protein